MTIVFNKGWCWIRSNGIFFQERNLCTYLEVAPRSISDRDLFGGITTDAGLLQLIRYILFPQTRGMVVENKSKGHLQAG